MSKPAKEKPHIVTIPVGPAKTITVAPARTIRLPVKTETRVLVSKKVLKDMIDRSQTETQVLVSKKVLKDMIDRSPKLERKKKRKAKPE